MKIIQEFKCQTQAFEFCKQLFAHPTTGCVVFDIDDTIVYEKKKQSVCIPRCKSFYNWLKQQHIPIHLITARPDYKENQKLLLEELDELGFHDYQSLTMMPSSLKLDDVDEIAQFKWNARHYLPQPILLNIGNAHQDLTYDITPCEQQLNDNRIYLLQFHPRHEPAYYSLKLKNSYKNTK